MARNGAGVYSLPAGQPVVTGTTISSTTFNTLMTDVANTLTTSVASDGQTAMSANLPMGGNKLTGLAAATVAGDAVRFEQTGALALTQGVAASGANSDITSLGNNTSTVYTTAGTSTAYTITPSPVIAAYAIGQSFFVNFNAASGATPTLQINGIATPPNLVKENADGTFSNIAANDIPINHRSRVTLISTTQALVERIAATSITIGTAAATTSGTSVTVTGLPATMKRLTAGLKNVSLSGTSNMLLQFGVAGSLVTTGYLSVAAGFQPAVAIASSTTGFLVDVGADTSAASLISGQIILTSMGNNDWVCSVMTVRDDGSTLFTAAGKVTLAGAPDRIALTTTNGTDTFDNGSFNIATES